MSPVVLVSRVGAAKGSRAVAAALACTASETDRAALLVDLDVGRAPRPTLVATTGARQLEERLAAHLPDAAIASRGRICQLKLPPGCEVIETLAAALPLARESASVVHMQPALLRAVLGDTRVRSTGVLLRANLPEDRGLTALAVRDLMVKGLQVGVVKRPLGPLSAAAAQLGALPAGHRTFLSRACERLLRTEDRRFRQCYDGRMKQGMSDRRLSRSGGSGEPRPGKRRQFVPARELAEAFADLPPIDFEQLRADLYKVVDPTPRDPYERFARIDRHIGRSRAGQS